MSAFIERAWLLYQQGRWDAAEKEVRAALALDPNDPHAHSLAALCLLAREKFDAATDEAQQTVTLAPDLPISHFVLSRVMLARNRFPEARAAIVEAIRLDPDNVDYFAQRAAIELESRNWQDALDAAETGLRIDPDHVSCTNLRVRALVKLGRRLEADEAVATALRKAPEDPLTHANRGWTLLEQGNPAKAMEHFREALRLDPELDWARAGIVEALKARHVLYRWMLGYFFWMSRLSRGAQWAVVIGLLAVFRIVNYVNEIHPQLGVVTRPLIVAYLAFFVLSWLSRPIFNTLLRFNRFGRLALSAEDRLQSNLVCLFLVPALIAAGLYIVYNESAIGAFAVLAGVLCGFTAIFVANVFSCSRGWPRLTMIAGTVTYLVAAIVSCVLLIRSYAGNGLFDLDRFDNAMKWNTGVLLPLAFVLLIGGNILAATRPKR